MSTQELGALRARLDREIAEDDARHEREEEQRQRDQLNREWRARQARFFAALRAERDRQREGS